MSGEHYTKQGSRAQNRDQVQASPTQLVYFQTNEKQMTDRNQYIEKPSKPVQKTPSFFSGGSLRQSFGTSGIKRFQQFEGMFQVQKPKESQFMSPNHLEDPSSSSNQFSDDHSENFKLCFSPETNAEELRSQPQSPGKRKNPPP